MKHIKLLFLLLPILFFASCQIDPILEMTTTEKTFNVSRLGESKTINFTCNKAWSITASESWCTIEPSIGVAGDISATVTIAPNDIYEARTCTLTVVVETLSEIIIVKQESALTINPSENLVDLTADAQTFGVAIESNVYYSTTPSVDWITRATASPTKALTTDSLFFEVALNPSFDSREGEIVFVSFDSTVRDTITVHQAGTPTPTFLNETVYGIYGDSDSPYNMLYSKYDNQLSLTVMTDLISFRIQDYVNLTFCVFYDIPKNAEVDGEFEMTMEHNFLRGVNAKIVFPVRVLKTSTDKMWLYNFENKLGFIINK